MDIRILVGIADESSRLRWSDFLQSHYGHEFQIGSSLFGSLTEALCQVRVTESTTGIVIISDQHDEFHVGIKDELEGRAPGSFVTIAITNEMPADKRMIDIDGVVTSSGDQNEWTHVLDRVVEKLAYMQRPSQKVRENDIPASKPRELASIDEFRDALSLRHDVYCTMGYLESGYLETGSKLEANWCDSRAKHYGLFVTTNDGACELAATARVILTGNWPAHSEEWTKQVIVSRRALEAHVRKQRRALAQWILPAFKAMDFLNLMPHAYGEQQWGELSRVIVGQRWRGHGFSVQLVKYVLNDMDEFGIDGLVLECLPVHVQIYATLGFKNVGQSGITEGIATTMNGMKKEPPLGVSSSLSDSTLIKRDRIET